MCYHSRLILKANLSIICDPCGKTWDREGITDLEGRENYAFIEVI